MPNVTCPPGEPAQDLFDAFSTLQALLLTAPQLETFLQEVAGVAAGLTPSLESCGVTVRHDRQAFTAACSGALAHALDEIQYRTGEGPCIEALRSGEPVVVDDLAAETRWPCFRPQAWEAGLRSGLAVPLRSAGTIVGALNLYGTTPHAAPEAVRDRAHRFAAQAERSLELALRQIRQAETVSQLEQALSSRTVIDQALGIVMAQQRCTAAAAFALLRAHSQNNNRKLRDVAADLVARVSGAPADPGRRFTRPGSTSGTRLPPSS